MNSTAIPIPVYFFLVVGGWLLVSLIFNVLSGWPFLARAYRADGPFDGELFSFCTARIGATRYRSCLTMGANSRGMYLSVFFLFRVGAVPLFIRWEEITTIPKKGLLFRYTEMRFQQVPSVALSVSEELGRELLFSRPAA